MYQMNIWSLKKDESIKLLLLLLREQLPSDCFVMDESQELDPRAIRLLKAGERGIGAYLYTYGQEPNKYGVHLELAMHAERNLANDLEVCEGLSFDRLVEILCVHFDLLPNSVTDCNSRGFS